MTIPALFLILSISLYYPQYLFFFLQATFRRLASLIVV
nr:MAG TPA_asm: hypothetical protein [Bacteriophage sp.]